jgi:competence protein ComEA
MTATALAHADPPRGRVDATELPTVVQTPASEVAAIDGVVNLNTATEDELVRVPGIGPARAAAITTLRTRVQRFRHVDDLLRVRGIGRVSLRGMRPYLTLMGETTLLSRPRRPRLQ